MVIIIIYTSIQAMAEINQKKLSNYKVIVICSSIATIIIWALTFILFATNWDKDERGTFGDMFGAVNALFSGLAFAGLYSHSYYATRRT